ncbi:hypothetical protein VTG60DRAFT_2353 [Thermothelomyces hinnuleus]
MLLSGVTLSSALLLAGIVSAQTPVGFEPEVKDRLEIIFGSKVVETPGADLERSANFQNPSAGPRRTNLHALITGFTPTSSPINATTPDGEPIYALGPPDQGSAGPVPYVGPAPPPETPPHPHRYVSLLYETAADFAVTREQVGQALGFDLAAFVEKVGLEAPPVRGGYFNVTG